MRRLICKSCRRTFTPAPPLETPPEIRRANAIKAAAALHALPPGRLKERDRRAGESIRKGLAKLSPEERRQRMAAALAAVVPPPPEKRREICRMGADALHALPVERLKERDKKAGESIRRHYRSLTPEEREARWPTTRRRAGGRRSQEIRTREERLAAGKRISETWKAKARIIETIDRGAVLLVLRLNARGSGLETIAALSGLDEVTVRTILSYYPPPAKAAILRKFEEEACNPPT